jgi:hypothetical protein
MALFTGESRLLLCSSLLSAQSISDCLISNPSKIVPFGVHLALLFSFTRFKTFAFSVQRHMIKSCFKQANKLSGCIYSNDQIENKTEAIIGRLEFLNLATITASDFDEVIMLLNGIIRTDTPTGSELRTCISCERQTCVLCKQQLPSRIFTFPEDSQQCAKQMRNFKADDDYFKHVSTVRDDPKCPEVKATYGFKICKECPQAPFLANHSTADSKGMCYSLYKLLMFLFSFFHVFFPSCSHPFVF